MGSWRASHADLLQGSELRHMITSANKRNSLVFFFPLESYKSCLQPFVQNEFAFSQDIHINNCTDDFFVMRQRNDWATETR